MKKDNQNDFDPFEITREAFNDHAIELFEMIGKEPSLLNHFSDDIVERQTNRTLDFVNNRHKTKYQDEDYTTLKMNNFNEVTIYILQNFHIKNDTRTVQEYMKEEHPDMRELFMTLDDLQ